MDIYIEHLQKLLNLYADYLSATSDKAKAEILAKLSDQAEELGLDANDEATRLENELSKEALESEREQDEAYRGNY